MSGLPPGVPEGSVPVTMWVEQNGDRLNVFAPNGEPFSQLKVKSADGYGIPVPPSPPRMVTLSVGGCDVQVPEADVRTVAPLPMLLGSADPLAKAVSMLIERCRAWVDANPEPDAT